MIGWFWVRLRSKLVFVFSRDPESGRGIMISRFVIRNRLSSSRFQQKHSTRSFLLVCQSPARHPVRTKMPRLEPNCLQRWMNSLLMPGSDVNNLTVRTLAAVQTTKSREHGNPLAGLFHVRRTEAPVRCQLLKLDRPEPGMGRRSSPAGFGSGLGMIRLSRPALHHQTTPQ